jgi:hypothetical protein
MCGYMLHSSLAYAGLGALLGAAIVLAGLPLYAWVRHRNRALAAQESSWSAGLAHQEHNRC